MYTSLRLKLHIFKLHTMEHSPFLIVFEGLDYAGKTLQANFLYNDLKSNYKVKLLKFPYKENKSGRLIERCLNSQFYVPLIILDLLFIINRFEFFYTFKSELEQCDFLIIDRYKCSGFAYSRLPLWLQKFLERSLPDEDLIIFLALGKEEQKRRFAQRRTELDILENQQIQERARSRFRNYLCSLETPRLLSINAHANKFAIRFHIHDYFNFCLRIWFSH